MYIHGMYIHGLPPTGLYIHGLPMVTAFMAGPYIHGLPMVAVYIHGLLMLTEYIQAVPAPAPSVRDLPWVEAGYIHDRLPTLQDLVKTTPG